MELRVLVLLCVAGLFTSCSDLPRGRLVHNPDVAREFAAGHVLPGYAYYLHGRERVPIAIIALKEELELVSRFWRRIPDPEKNLPPLIKASRDQQNPACRFVGALITTPDGKIAGYWYSKWELTSIRIPEPGKIIVFPPVEPAFGPCAPEKIFWYND